MSMVMLLQQRRWRASAVILMILIGLTCGLVGALAGGATADTIEILRPAALIVSGLVAAHSRARGRRLPWLLLALMGLTEGVGATAELIAHGSVNILSRTPVGALAFLLAPLLLLMISIASSDLRRRDGIALVDALAIGSAVLAAVWTNGWMDEIFGAQVTPSMRTLNLVGFFIDGMMMVFLFGILVRAKGIATGRGMPILLMIAMVSSVLTDMTGALMSTADSDQWGQLPWTIKVAAAAAAPWLGPAFAPAQERRSWLDLSSVTVAVYLVTIPLVVHGLRSAVGMAALVITGSGTTLLVLRLWLANWDNGRLARRLEVGERAYRQLAQQTHSVVARVDRAGAVLSIDAARTRGPALEHEALLHTAPGTPWSEVLYADDRQSANEWWQAEATSTLHVRLPYDGGYRWMAAVQSPSADGTRLIGFRDIDDEVRHLLSLEAESTTDALTGLPNRRALQSLLGQRIVESAQHSAQSRIFGVLYCDLDGFKHVNDGHGHDVGDEILDLAAQRILTAVGMAGVATRFGGDEFVVVTDFESETHWQALAAELASAIVAEVDRPFEIVANRVSVSIGIASWEPGLTAAALLQRADLAMYRAKIGRGTLAFFDPELDDRPAATARDLGQSKEIEQDREPASTPDLPTASPRAALN